MTLMEDKIVNTILSDEELINYIEKLVAKRLPAGPHLKSDYNWYKQVIDLSINQAFEDLQVVDTLNYQISQLGKYLEKSSSRHNQNSNEESCEENDLSNSDTRNVDHPSFSSSEPVQRSRKVVSGKALTKKLVREANSKQSNMLRHNDDDRVQERQAGQIRQGQNGNDKSSDDVGHNGFSSSLPHNRNSKSVDSSKVRQLSQSTSYKSELNNLQDTKINRDTSTATEEKIFPTEIDVSDGSFSLKVNNTSISRGMNEHSKNSPSRYSNQPPLTGDSVDSGFQVQSENEEEDESIVDIRKMKLSSKSPLVPTLTNGSAFALKSKPKRSDLYFEDAVEGGKSPHSDDVSSSHSITDPSSSSSPTIVQGRACVSHNEETRNGIIAGVDKYVDEYCDDNGHSNDHGNDGSNRIDIRRNGVDRTSQNGQDESHPSQIVSANSISNEEAFGVVLVGEDEEEGEGRAERGGGEGEGENNVDEDTCYESDFDHKEEVAKSSFLSNRSQSQIDFVIMAGKKGENGIYASWSMPSDNVATVRFVPNVVSDVFIIREKHSLYEIPDLFYTHDESIQFTSDYNRESLKAEAVGLTWYEWWGDRTEDDVMRDDAERLEEEAVEYEEDSVGIADDVSDGTDDFSF